MSENKLSGNDLSEEDVSRLVYSYEDKEATNELQSFGQILLDEANDWAKQIDSKATGVLGWATAILAFLFTQLTKASGLDLMLGVASGLFAVLAVRRAYKALQARKGWLAQRPRLVRRNGARMNLSAFMFVRCTGRDALVWR